MKRVILFSFLVTVLFYGVSIAYDNCAETGGGGAWLVCEDYDQEAAPAADWPYPDGTGQSYPDNGSCTAGVDPRCSTWHGFTPNDTAMSSLNGIQSTYAYSGNALRIKTYGDVTKGPGGDHSISLGGSHSVIYIRWYMMIPDFDEFLAAHFMFFDDNWFAGGGIIDIFTCYGPGYTGCSTGYYIGIGSDGTWRSSVNNGNTPWNLEAHEGEWHAYEFKLDVGNHLFSIWVDGDPVMEDLYDASFSRSLTAIGISGWQYQNPPTGYSVEYYIDNLVVSESYIGLADDGNITCYNDDDNDTYQDESGLSESVPTTCSSNYYESGHFAGEGPSADDCDDTNAAINPGATDSTCNGIDEDCSDSDNCGNGSSVASGSSSSISAGSTLTWGAEN